MSIPSVARQQLIVSFFGAETLPKSVILKGTFWTVFSLRGNLYLKEYEGIPWRRIREQTTVFQLSRALDSSNNIKTDTFWLWEITSTGLLRLVEMEPFVDSPPVIQNQQVLFLSSVLNVSPDVHDGMNLRLFVLEDGTPKTLKIHVYDDVWSGTPVVTEDLEWDADNLDEFDADTPDSDRSIFDLAYPNVSSPSNIYTVDYSLSVPQIISASQVGITLQIAVSWDTITGGENYRLERSINDPTFSSPTVVYSGPNTNTTDTVPFYNTTYWYRVKLEMPSLGIESDWSTAVSAATGGLPIEADFEGIPTSGVAPLDVQFTDQSVGVVDTWFWDFGDGNTLGPGGFPNPLHTYITVGTFTVSMTASGPGDTNTKTKPDYITVAAPAPVAGFSADILVGYPPLIVKFKDESSSYFPITEWLWDFGDGYTSTEQEPEHTFNKVQNYTVSLTVKNQYDISDTETKTNYIKVLEIPVLVDFTGQPRTGEAPLQVRFSNLTEYPDDYAEPTWEWDFGDGERSTQKNPTHTYIQDRFKTVTLAAKIVLIPNVTP
jgi:PKD repeat protein